MQAHTVGEVTPFNAAIELVEYDPRWPELYAREEKRIRKALGGKVRRVEHVGSTSVPGLAAKPIIDIVLTVPDSADEPAYVPELEAAGYVLRIREPEWFEHRLFKGPDTNVNLHVFTNGSDEVERMTAFRDHLRNDPEELDLYLRTKRELAGRSGGTCSTTPTRNRRWSRTSSPARCASAPSSNACRLLARDHAAPVTTLALAKALSLGRGRVRPLAWCSQPRSSAASLDGALTLRDFGVARGEAILEPLLGDGHDLVGAVAAGKVDAHLVERGLGVPVRLLAVLGDKRDRPEERHEAVRRGRPARQPSASRPVSRPKLTRTSNGGAVGTVTKTVGGSIMQDPSPAGPSA
jgi:GrpB-like predicted nucleotidyltransferase (UPF0157 family)